MKKSLNLSQFHPSPEFLWMLSCLRMRWNPKKQIYPASLPQKIDWESLLSLLQYHQVLPLVYQSLQNKRKHTIPAGIRGKMRESYKQNAQRTLHMTAELVEILDEFKENHVRAIPLKGPTLSQKLYGNLHSRIIKDLDMMIPVQDLSKAERILKKKNYRRRSPPEKSSLKKVDLFMRNGHHFHYLNSGSQTRVDLHWKLIRTPQRLPLTFKDMWENKETVLLGGREIPTLSKEQTFLYLCEHGSNHAFYRLFWLCDVAEFIHQNPRIKWEKLLERAHRLNIFLHTAQAFYVSNRVFQTPLPEKLREIIPKNRLIKSLSRKSLFFIIRSKGFYFKPLTKEHWLAKTYKSQREFNLKHKLLYWIKELFYRESDWDRVSLPDWAFPLYYILRPILFFQRGFTNKKNVLELR